MRRSALTVGMIPLVLAVNAIAGGATPVRAGNSSDTLVNVGSPSTQFPRNKQNEPAVSVAIDPSHPNVVVSGSNDEIDNAPCAASDCSFTPGVTDNGVYFSFNGGELHGADLHGLERTHRNTWGWADRDRAGVLRKRDRRRW
jgi:hypothetical protein